ncbi:MAG: hypothetical protein FJ280_27600 [Planctomycetes bacterium]|nr:hypothetical protein [Planctomycetota bacterium]
MELLPIRLDLEQMRQNLLRQREPERVFFFEHAIADNVKDQLAQRFNVDERISGSPGGREWKWRREIELQRALGFELFRVWLPGADFKIAGVAGTSFEEEHVGPLQSWADLEKYPWPDPGRIDFSQLEYYDRRLPSDMGVYHVVTLWETVRRLIGFESFCYKLYEEPQFIDEVVQRVASFQMAFVQALCHFRCVFAVYASDDYGYKSSTLMAPQIIVDRFLTRHKALGDLTHRHSKLLFFHSCGKVDPLMDYLIDEVQIDAKHSFEDVIVPVTEAKKRWGKRVSLLGGLDVDFIARSDEQAIRQRVRETLEACQVGGGYCLGLGNWVTAYIPVDNYLAMLDEGRRFGMGS